MDTREKLVDLILSAHERIRGVALECEGKTYEGCVEIEADYLIANGVKVQELGVMVQEWISVEDRLPPNFISVLGYMTDAGDFPPVRECYTVGNAFFFPALGEVHPVSHWMPFPEPPKGE